MNEYWPILLVPVYLIIGAIVNGLMHRYDPRTFDCSNTQVALVVFWWVILVPIYWFCIFADRCIVWFEKKEK
jgi:hypothetical protein